MKKTSVEVVVTDTHAPYHDERCWGAALAVIRKAKPDVVHHLGDLLDFCQLSKYLRDPKQRTSTFEDILIGHKLLRQLRAAAPQAVIHLSEGNHDARLRRYLWTRADDLHDLPGVSLTELLEIKKLGLLWHPETAPYKSAGFWFRHGTKVSPHAAYSARAELERAGGSIITGHTHRIGMHTRATYEGISIAWEAGCLCKIDPSIHQYTKGPPNWQQGLLLIYKQRGEYPRVTPIFLGAT